MRCPAHDDRRASLSIGTGDDGRILLHCKAGCTVDAILTAMHLEKRDLFPDSSRATKARTIKTTYDYTDEAGTMLLQVVRYEPKEFKQRKPDGAGGWTWKLGDVRRVLFGLPELVTVRQECDRLAEAIGQGGPLDALVARLTARQARGAAIEMDLSLRGAERPHVNLEALEARMRAKLADWRGLLQRNVQEGRAVLRALLIGPLRFTPVVDERRRGYAFEGTIALDRLLAGVLTLPTKVASPTGFEPVF